MGRSRSGRRRSGSGSRKRSEKRSASGSRGKRSRSRGRSDRGSRGGGGGGESGSVLVRNLDFYSAPSAVREAFGKCGKIKDVYLPLDYNTGKPKGFGFVEFFDKADADHACREMDGYKLDNGVLSCTPAQDRRKSPKTMGKIQGKDGGKGGGKGRKGGSRSRGRGRGRDSRRRKDSRRRR